MSMFVFAIEAIIVVSFGAVCIQAAMSLGDAVSLWISRRFT